MSLEPPISPNALPASQPTCESPSISKRRLANCIESGWLRTTKAFVVCKGKRVNRAPSGTRRRYGPKPRFLLHGGAFLWAQGCLLCPWTKTPHAKMRGRRINLETNRKLSVEVEWIRSRQTIHAFIHIRRHCMPSSFSLEWIVARNNPSKQCFKEVDWIIYDDLLSNKLAG